MDDMATGCVMGNIDENISKNGRSWDFAFPLLLIAALYGGEELKEAMMKAVEDKAKEVVARGEQLVSEADKPESDAE